MRVFFCTVALLVCASLLRPSTSFAQTSSLLVLDSAAIAESGARTLAELLAARVPGVDVTWLSGAPGFAAHVSVRGAPGGTGSGRPNLYVDGVLLRDDQHWLMAELPDGQRPAHHWDLPVEELHEVRVVLGAGGGAFLELGSSRGAVIVTTARPRDAQWRLQSSAQLTRVAASPAVQNLSSRMGTWSGGGVTNVCSIYLEARGECTPTGPTTLQSFAGENPFGASSGGRIALSGAGAVLGTSARVGAVGDATPGALGERFDRLDLSVGLSRDVGARLRLGADLRSSFVDGSYNATNLLRTLGSHVRNGPDSGLGIAGLAPDDIIEIGQQTLSLRRLHGSASAQVRVGRADVLDVAIRTEQLTRGFRRPLALGATLDRDALTLATEFRATRQLRSSLDATLRVAAWHQRMQFEEVDQSAGLELDLETTSLVVGTELQSAGKRTLGGGLRLESNADNDSWPPGDSPLAFISASWAISEESWMPRLPLLPHWNVGASYGESTDQQAFHDATVELLKGNSLGLSAERALEREASVEASSAGRRFRLVARAFERRVAGSHINVPEAVVIGSSQRLRPNIPIETFGGELALRVAQNLGAASRLEVTAWVARAQSRFGAVNFGSSLISIGELGYWTTGYGERYGGLPRLAYAFADTSGDGVITQDEVSVSGIGGVYSSMPTHTSGIVVSLRDVGGWSAGFSLDGKFGHRRYDLETARRCFFRLCDEQFDPSTPLERQAVIARSIVQDYAGDFVRVRELWLRRTVRKDSRRPITLSLVGQNLLTWTRYPGRDPEVTALFRPGMPTGESFQEPVRPALSLRVDIGAQ